MSNPDPAILTEEVVQQRMKRAQDASVDGVQYRMYMGVTADMEQVKRAADIYTRYEEVVGIKLFAGHSVRNLGIIRRDDQYRVYQTLTAVGFNGVMPVHCEKESCMDHTKWNPTVPVSHCMARPAQAEVESVEDQIELAMETKFSGKLHIAHISTPEAVLLVDDARRSGMNISCGVCPHHFVYDCNQMFELDGILWKMNPPLREPGKPQQMLEYLRAGKIDWIETDHAPHSLTEKLQHPFMSGIPGLPWWGLFEEFLRFNGFSDKRIREVTYENVLARFNLDIEYPERPRVDRRNDYPFNPYAPLEELLKYR
jgi:dihydroorotase